MSIETITNAQLSPYERIGGAPTIRALVNRFYDLMDLEPKYLELREVHGSTLEEAGNRLYMFLSGWLGGPDLYTEQHGHPRLRSRHFPFKIGTLERDQWVACFTQSMVELNVRISRVVYSLFDKSTFEVSHKELSCSTTYGV